jgi:FKBP-type peptidyl-prolyl cis-trans isomerase
MNDQSKNKWIAVVVALVVAALFFGVITLYSFNRNVEEALNGGVEATSTVPGFDQSALLASTSPETMSQGTMPATSGSLTTNTPKKTMTTTSEGLIIEDITVGTGETAQVGQTVSVHYVGTLQDGTKFDSSLDRGQPFSFTIGQGRVIQGWEQGVQGMKVGGKRKLVIPPALGYGDRAVGNVIPANATLVFEIDLLAVQK